MILSIKKRFGEEKKIFKNRGIEDPSRMNESPKSRRKVAARNQSSNKRNCVMSPNLAFGYVKLGTRYRSYSTVMLSMDGKRKYSYIQYPSFLPGTRYNFN